MTRKPQPDPQADAGRWRSEELQRLESGIARTRSPLTAGDERGEEANAPAQGGAESPEPERGERGADLARRGRQRPELSLKGRALRYLSQREHSRFELARKLARYEPDTETVNALLDDLERDGWLSSERFVESIVHRRAQSFGLRRIQQELGEHRIESAQVADTLASLRETEFDRALAVWRRKFDRPPDDLQAKARQHRYLAARGFDGDVISRVLRAASRSVGPDGL